MYEDNIEPGLIKLATGINNAYLVTSGVIKNKNFQGQTVTSMHHLEKTGRPQLFNTYPHMCGNQASYVE